MQGFPHNETFHMKKVSFYIALFISILKSDIYKCPMCMCLCVCENY